MTPRIGQKIAKRRRWPVEHQQAIFLAFGEAVSAGEFKDAPQLIARSRPVRVIHPCFLRPNHTYSAAAIAGLAWGKKAASSPITSLIRLES